MASAVLQPKSVSKSTPASARATHPGSTAAGGPASATFVDGEGTATPTPPKRSASGEAGTGSVTVVSSTIGSRDRERDSKERDRGQSFVRSFLSGFTATSPSRNRQASTADGAARRQSTIPGDSSGPNRDRGSGTSVDLEHALLWWSARTSRKVSTAELPRSLTN
jgi:hypothetical protein